MYDTYKGRGGVKSFKDYSAAFMAKQRAAGTSASTTGKVRDATNMVSGKLRSKLRKPMKRKYSI
jgi:hypothetical protein